MTTERFAGRAPDDHALGYDLGAGRLSRAKAAAQTASSATGATISAGPLIPCHSTASSQLARTIVRLTRATLMSADFPAGWPGGAVPGPPGPGRLKLRFLPSPRRVLCSGSKRLTKF
jgi:hypothetical protein